MLIKHHGLEPEDPRHKDKVCSGPQWRDQDKERETQIHSADGELADPKTWKENEGYRIPEFLGQSTCILCVNF